MKSKQIYDDLLKENKKLNQTVNEQALVIKELQEERDQLKKENFDLEDDVINSLRQERDDYLERKFFYQDKVKEYEQMVKVMEDERAELKGTVLNLEKRLEAGIKSDECRKTKENLCTDLENHPPPKEEDTPNNNVAKSSQSSDSGICINLETLKEEIGKSIDSMIETKLNNICVQKLKDSKKTAPTRNVIIDDRENNLIIHGMTEDDCKTSEEDKVEDLFQAINVEYKPATIFRLGVKQETRNRPLMVRLSSKEENVLVLSKLGRLKYARRKYEDRISVTHDYTLEERKTIKELVGEAKRRNTLETNEGVQGYTWKVRGMQLVKICTTRA